MSVLSHSLGPNMVRGPTPSIRNSRRSFISLMFGVVIVRNVEIGGRVGMLRMAWLGPMTRSARRA